MQYGRWPNYWQNRWGTQYSHFRLLDTIFAARVSGDKTSLLPADFILSQRLQTNLRITLDSTAAGFVFPISVSAGKPVAAVSPETGPRMAGRLTGSPAPFAPAPHC